MQTKDKNVITPLGEKVCPIINDDIILVPILRAGVSMLGAFQRLFPMARQDLCGHIEMKML